MQAGWARREIVITPRGLAMQGYGKWTQRDRGYKTPLYARAIALAADAGPPLIFCCLDLGYITHAMRQGVIEKLAGDLDEERLILTCTHTHSGPGGCTHDIMYNLVTPGFAPDYLAAIVAAAAASILAALHGLAPALLELRNGTFGEDIDVAWNRSLNAYNRNGDVHRRTQSQTHLALDRSMAVLSLRRQRGVAEAIFSLFGVHATCIGSSNTLYDGDNKGRAALHAEDALRQAGAPDPVAIFAQATAGDVSPHYHGPGQKARRRAVSGDGEYAYAQHNGQMQSTQALQIVASAAPALIEGDIDAVFAYIDFTTITADPAYAGGERNAITSEPCHGTAFFGGTPVDGPGLPPPFLWLMRKIAAGIRKRRLARLAEYSTEHQTYYRRLYAAQGAKDIMQESGRKILLGQSLDRISVPDFIDPAVAEIKRQARAGAMAESAMVPTVLPLQIVLVGTLALICAPGEFTTVAGARLRACVAARLAPRGVTGVLLCTYCNDYMGYVTTFEEYQAQAYEGGHTIFGQWTLAAFQTKFAELADQLCRPARERTYDGAMRPKPTPAAELALRTAKEKVGGDVPSPPNPPSFI